ncbi:MAG TPA: peptidoglycan-binding protein, partial [Clostridiaceae bacterium]|nr:peptidoglycan-binding protein [Clostridiaceae bacterium]
KFNAESMASAITRGINSQLNPTSDKPLLRRGSTNYSAVSYMQSLLGVDSDGIFGPVTENAVISFQKRLGIMVDGVVGQQTWGNLLK